MCVLTEQRSGQLQKQHMYNEITSNNRDEQRLVRERERERGGGGGGVGY